MVTEVQPKPAFEALLSGMTASDWRLLVSPPPAWDGAWENALALGALALALPAMAVARQAGAGLAGAALAGAAAAALQLEDELGRADVEALLAPFAAILAQPERRWSGWRPAGAA